MTRPQQAEKNTAEHAATKEKPANVSYYCINRDRIVTIIRKVAYDWVLILPEEKKKHVIAREYWIIFFVGRHFLCRLTVSLEGN